MSRIVPFEEDAGVVVGFDGVAFPVFGRFYFVERLDWACGAEPRWMGDAEFGVNGLDSRIEDDGNSVHPMCANVGDSAKFAAFAREEAPVEVFGLDEPILEVGALDVNDAAKATGGDVGAHLQNSGIEADVVIDGEDLFGIARAFADEFGGFFGRHGERFFADDVFAGAQGSEGLRGMFFIGRGNVNDVDFGRVDEGVEIVVEEDVWDVPFSGDFAGAVGTGDGGDADAEALQSFDVDRADEARTDDAGAELMDGTFNLHGLK